MKGTHLPEADDSFALVEDWLRSLGLLCYAQQFYDNGYEDLEIIKKIGDSDLNAIGIKNEKDRNDIIAGVHRLKQRPVYFELEPEQEELFDVPQKFDPLLLKTLVKESLEKDDTKLTEPPYFYPVSIESICLLVTVPKLFLLRPCKTCL